MRDDKTTRAADRASQVFDWSHTRFMHFLASTPP
jgi:hypothetical protein